MKSVRIGNDFIFLWKLHRGDAPEKLSQANNFSLTLYKRIFGRNGIEVPYSIISGNTIKVEITPEIADINGNYYFKTSYNLNDSSLSDNEREVKRDVAAFQIVPRTFQSDDVYEVTVVTNILSSDTGVEVVKPPITKPKADTIRRVRKGNDFVFEWRITRSDEPEKFSRASNIKLLQYCKRFGENKIEITDYRIRDGFVSIDITSEIAGSTGVYYYELHYEMVDYSLSTNKKGCVVDVSAFQIVERTSHADDVFKITTATSIDPTANYENIEEAIEYILSQLEFDSKYLSKVNPDTAEGLITFLGGLTSTTADIKYLKAEKGDIKSLTSATADIEDLKADKGDIKSLTSATAIIDNITLHKGMSSEVFFPGFLGEGMELFLDENGNWNFTLDNLTVRKQLNVFEMVINIIKHVGGAFLFSPAGGTFIGVEEHGTFWRCYVEDKNNNEFEIYDQVICQTFTKNRLKRYWRLAVNTGEDFVDLSKTDCESGSAYPEIDDEAVVLGNRVNKARQNAVLISSYGEDGSYQQFLNGVDTYSLADKIDIHFGKESFMRVNRLEIKGTDGKSERVPRDRGIFQLGETYEFYDRVVYNGRYWLCLAIKTTSAPSDGEWQEQTNVRAGGKNLLREYDLRFDGKYWQGSYDSQFIDLSMLSDYLFNGNNDAIVTEDNIYIEL